MSISGYIKHSQLGDIKITDENNNVGNFCFQEDSPYFDGHFPDNPVLPGVVQVMLAVYVASVDTNLKLTNIKRCKFMRMIRPKEEIKVVVFKEKKGEQRLAKATLMIKQEICATITFVLGLS
ncbi:3-hydroxyacyl-ACP dehydratase FabZ family protein [Desulfovibrio litoralis]|uniref:3-hydroxyacyl-[acyl-carrier-protein] dehydratase n=1 Tax=Desulfovibrio litoralis DSM 11393 TaxID=1121455 RepID=A0A1M7STQ8_9BACT|nr:hypothetical protein [Desulfovibrio litoralis]SHN61862.1 3-hydroxyacyl-[acyl-carrier-protein] dehydratase [Desulfovibrio litoralis DSM 11393]